MKAGSTLVPESNGWPLLRRWGAGGMLVLLSATSLFPAAPWVAPNAMASGAPGHVWIAGENSREVIDYNVAASRVERRLPLAFAPSGVLAIGNQLWVTGGIPTGVLARLDGASGQVLATTAMPSGAAAPTALGTGLVAVLNRFAGSVSILDGATGNEVRRIGVGREPVAAVYAAPRLFIAHLLPEQRSTDPVVAAAVSVVDPVNGDVVRRILLPNGSIDVRGIAFMESEKMVAVVHSLARFDLPTTQVERGWMNTSALTLVRVEDPETWATVLLDDPENGAANPFSVGVSAEGKNLFITHGGTHEVSILPVGALLEKIRGEPDRSVLSTKLPFVYPLRTRLATGGLGPRAMVITPAGALVAHRFSDSVTLVRVDGKPSIATTPLGEAPSLTSAQRGELAFHNATLCVQQWQSCSSCHPDGRVDALNWDLLNDGLGNPKNVRSLLFAHRRSPVMSHGIRANAETAVRAGIKNILFTSQPDETAQDLDAFLKSLVPVPSPHLVDGKIPDLAVKGKVVFEKAGCSGCHPAPLYTDTKVHEVGTRGPNDSDGAFLTPTLVELWRTAPYLHDGRSVTLEEALTGPGLHGMVTGKMAPGDRDALIAWLKSL